MKPAGHINLTCVDILNLINGCYICLSIDGQAFHWEKLREDKNCLVIFDNEDHLIKIAKMSNRLVQIIRIDDPVDFLRKFVINTHDDVLLGVAVRTDNIDELQACIIGDRKTVADIIAEYEGE